QPTAGAAGGVEQYREQEDIDEGEHEQVQVALALVQQQGDEHIADQVDPAGALVEIGVLQVDQPVAQGRAGQQGQEKPEPHPIDIVDTQYFRALGVNRVSVVGPHRGARCSNTIYSPGAGPDVPAGAAGIVGSGPSLATVAEAAQRDASPSGRLSTGARRERRCTPAPE